MDIGPVVEAIKNEEGCQLFGYLLINRVPGNFHLSSHAFHDYLQRIFQLSGTRTIDMSHKINHISFGDDSEIKEIMKYCSLFPS